MPATIDHGHDACSALLWVQVTRTLLEFESVWLVIAFMLFLAPVFAALFFHSATSVL